MNCNVCGTTFGSSLYQSGSNVSLTTMNALIEGETKIFFCDHCGHTQTNELDDLERYYAEEYEINIDSVDDDQLYAVVDGEEVYRSEHQANVLMQKIDLSRFSNVLDYGCAKAATLRAVRSKMPELQLYFFDVTNKYVPFWKEFENPKSYASFKPNPDWFGKIEVLLSFYALEHIPDLNKILNDVKQLLCVGGYFYFLVPNLYQNAADFIVADHVNHFSRSSLKYMMEHNGFYDVDIDENAHFAAFVVSGRLGSAKNEATPSVLEHEIRETKDKAKSIAELWDNAKDHIHAFEANSGIDANVAIYGAGIYGNFIFSCLKKPNAVQNFIDRNKFLIGRKTHGKLVISPDDPIVENSVIYVGLNPRSAKQIIGSLTNFQNKSLSFFFLDD